MDTIIVIDSKLIDSNDTIRVTTLEELAELHKLIERRLTGAAITLTKDNYIRVETALATAKQQGINLPRTTLIGALLDGNIHGVRKPKGRWEMPETEFLKWLEKYSLKHGKATI